MPCHEPADYYGSSCLHDAIADQMMLLAADKNRDFTNSATELKHLGAQVNRTWLYRCKGMLCYQWRGWRHFNEAALISGCEEEQTNNLEIEQGLCNSSRTA